MEEFEKEQPVTDDERHLAEGRKVTLTPLHADVTPEDTPGLEYMASERATKTQQNISNDAEDTSNQDQLKRPAASQLADKTILHKTPSHRRLVVLIVSAIIIALLVAVAFWLIQI